MRALAISVLLLAVAACAHGTSEPTGPPLSESERAEATRLLRLAEVAPEQLAGRDDRRALVQLASQHKCPCPAVSGTLAECAGGGSCIRAAFAVRAIARGLARGEREEAITGRLLERFGPREPEQVDIKGNPCRGPADAPVTLVVFSDFQCPFCAMAAKLTEAVQDKAAPRLRVCFKHWPLTSIHPRAQLAAQAAAAAQLQGKFWQMHDQLYANPRALDREDFVDHAREVGLDVARFERDLESDAVLLRVKQDANEAERLELLGTPSFLINGRRMTDPKTIPDFLDWIAEAIALARKTPRSRPGE